MLKAVEPKLESGAVDALLAFAEEVEAVVKGTKFTVASKLGNFIGCSIPESKPRSDDHDTAPVIERIRFSLASIRDDATIISDQINRL